MISCYWLSLIDCSRMPMPMFDALCISRWDWTSTRSPSPAPRPTLSRSGWSKRARSTAPAPPLAPEVSARDELYKNRSSRKTDSQQEKRSSQSPILLIIVSENQFSGKTYFYTIAPEVQKDLKKREEPFYSCDVVVKEECSDDNYWWEDNSENHDAPDNNPLSKRKRGQTQKDSETNAKKKVKQNISDVKEEHNSNNVERKKCPYCDKWLREQLYKNRSSRKIDFQRLFPRE